MYAYILKHVYLSEIDFNHGKWYNSFPFAVWQHDNLTLGFGQKAVMLHPITRLISALVKKHQMGSLLSDTWQQF